MSRLAGAAGVVAVLVLVMFFARWNSGELVTLDLGFRTFFRVPLTFVAFGSLILGMLVMLLAGLHADLRVRRFLRERLAEENRKEPRWIDGSQVDMFGSAPGPAQGSESAKDPGPGSEPSGDSVHGSGSAGNSVPDRDSNSREDP